MSRTLVVGGAALGEYGRILVVACGLLIGCDKARAFLHESTRAAPDPAALDGGAAVVATATAADPVVADGGRVEPAPIATRDAGAPAKTVAAVTDTKASGGGDGSGSGGGGGGGRREAEVATGSTLTEFQRKRLLGHYSTYDGASGFILDRTVSPYRAKLDGVASYVTLAESNGPLETKEYRGGGMWIRIDKSGNVLLFDGPKQTEGVRVIRDADAKQLK